MFKKILSAGAALLAGVTAACEDGPSTVPGGWRSPAVWSVMIDASKSGPILLDVRGVFPGSDSEASARQAAAAMSGQMPARPVAFTLDAAAAARPQVRVVLVIDPARNLDPKDICAGDIRFEQSEPGKVRIAAAFCDKSGLLSSTSGWAAKLEGPQDRRLNHLLAQAVRDLFGTPN